MMIRFLNYLKTAIWTFSLIFTTLISSQGSTQEVLSEEQLKLRGYIRHDDFVLNAIPKCGTHLIMNCLSHLLNTPVDEGYDYVREDQYTDAVAQNYLNYLLNIKASPWIHKTHVPYFPKMEHTLLQADLKSIFLIRDPRDAIASLVFYLETMSGNQRDFITIDSTIYNRLSLDKKIEALMTGSCCTNYLNVYLKPFMGWTRTNYGFVARFEDLIGEFGGGTLENQQYLIEQMAAYLNVRVSSEEILAIATYTNSFKTPVIQNSMDVLYPRAQIGSWKAVFNDHNKKLFKRLFGPELIELGYEVDNNW